MVFNTGVLTCFTDCLIYSVDRGHVKWMFIFFNVHGKLNR